MSIQFKIVLLTQFFYTCQDRIDNSLIFPSYEATDNICELEEVSELFDADISLLLLKLADGRKKSIDLIPSAC